MILCVLLSFLLLENRDFIYNFKIKDYLIEKAALNDFEVCKNMDGVIVTFSKKGLNSLKVLFTMEGERTVVKFLENPNKLNRLWLRLAADKEEHIYGCGEQFSDFDFSNEDFHELQIWGIPEKVIFETGKTYEELVGKLTAFLGRQPELPEWVHLWTGKIYRGGDNSHTSLDNSSKLHNMSKKREFFFFIFDYLI